MVTLMVSTHRGVTGLFVTRHAVEELNDVSAHAPTPGLKTAVKTATKPYLVNRRIRKAAIHILAQFTVDTRRGPDGPDVLRHVGEETSTAHVHVLIPDPNTVEETAGYLVNLKSGIHAIYDLVQLTVGIHHGPHGLNAAGPVAAEENIAIAIALIQDPDTEEEIVENWEKLKILEIATNSHVQWTVDTHNGHHGRHVQRLVKKELEIELVHVLIPDHSTEGEIVVDWEQLLNPVYVTQEFVQHLQFCKISNEGISTEADLILCRAGIFASSRKENIVVCSLHRDSLGIYWRGQYKNCQVPISIAAHSKRSRGDRSVGKRLSQSIFERTNELLPVGSLDGGYSQWTPWSSCTKTCEEGTRNRTRSCTNPRPQHGGRDCSRLGTATQSSVCNTRICPENSGYSDWSSWSQCTKTCGVGTQNRTRYCKNSTSTEKRCEGPASQSKRCNTQMCRVPVDGQYSGWSAWSQCTKSCGGGTRERTRTCTNPSPKNGGKNCKELGPSEDKGSCNTHACQRVCKDVWPSFCGTNAWICNEESWKTYVNQNCRYSCGLCQVDGRWSTWSAWSTWDHCSVTCGGGIKYRYRQCNKQRPRNGGISCRGKGRESEICNTNACPASRESVYVQKQENGVAPVGRSGDMPVVCRDVWPSFCRTNAWICYEGSWKTYVNQNCRYSCGLCQG
ncbi:Coadhesin [Exaiptasia diaphana]|nr:Coadhesin [Exaiptasia diaphana]